MAHLARKFRFDSSKKKEKLLGGSEDTVKPEHIKGPHITLYSNKEMTVDGCTGVIEYCDTYLKLRTGKGSLTLFGSNFDITAFDEHLLTVRGVFSSLEFSL